MNSVLTDEEIMALNSEPQELAVVDRKEELERQAETWPEKARAAKIVDQQTYNAAAEMLLGIKDLRKQIDETFDPIIKSAHEAHKTACDAKKKAESPLADAESIIKRMIGAWSIEQERIRREAEERARIEAAKLEEEMRIQAAVNAAEAGADTETVAQIMETPQPIIMPTVAPTFESAVGISTRKVWKYRIVDEKLIPREFLMPNERAISAIVKGMKGKTNIPGIEVYEEIGVAAGRR